MEKPVIFALTPRAGCWNHRYVVPAGATWSQQLLSALAGEPQQNTDAGRSLRAVRQVKQETTGRVGPEYLIVQDERLATVGPADRDKFEEQLRSQLYSLEGLITNEIDWERKSELVVDHPRISELQEDWENRLRDGKRPEAPPPKPKWITVLIVVGLLVLGLLGFQQLGRRAGRQGGPAQKTGLPEPLARFVRDVATAVGVSIAREEDTRLLLSEVVKKLEKELFLPEQEPASTRKAQRRDLSASAKHPPEELERFEQVITRFYRFVFPGEPEKRFNELIADQGILKMLGLLYRKGYFDPIGLVDSDSTDPILRSLRTVDAYRFHRIVACMHRLQDAISKLKWANAEQKGDTYDNFLHKLNQPIRSLPAPPKDDQECVPRFYRNEDAEAGKKLKAPLTSSEALKLVPMSPIPEDLPSVLCKFGSQYREEKSGGLLSQRALEFSRKRWDDERSPQRKVFDRLTDFTEACSQLRDPAPARERDR